MQLGPHLQSPQQILKENRQLHSIRAAWRRKELRWRKCRAVENLAQDFELIVISEDISEGDSVYAAGRKQVFIYDDFLGRTDIREKLGKNEDNRLVEFIRRVHRSPMHRFILTTREYILRAAQQDMWLDTGGLRCISNVSSR